MIIEIWVLGKLSKTHDSNATDKTEKKTQPTTLPKPSVRFLHNNSLEVN